MSQSKKHVIENLYRIRIKKPLRNRWIFLLCRVEKNIKCPKKTKFYTLSVKCNLNDSKGYREIFTFWTLYTA